MPMEFERAATEAEWLDGMPPLERKGAKLHFLFMIASTKHLMSCAANIDIKADQNTGLRKMLSFTL